MAKSTRAGKRTSGSRQTKEEKELEDLIKTYDMHAAHGKHEGELIVNKIKELKKDKRLEEVRLNKDKILNYINNKAEKEKEQRRMKFEERQKKIQSITGLQEIRNAADEYTQYNRRLNRSFYGEGGGGVGVGQKPTANIAELKKKYPRAAAYLQAEKLSNASNYELQSIGREAVEKILSGKSYKKTLEEAKKKVSKLTDRWKWD